MTHTYVEMELDGDAYDMIAKKMRDAGYDQAFLEGGAIDMRGIAVTRGNGALELGAELRRMERA